jgi:hypothetical protein
MEAMNMKVLEKQLHLYSYYDNLIEYVWIDHIRGLDW